MLSGSGIGGSTSDPLAARQQVKLFEARASRCATTRHHEHNARKGRSPAKAMAAAANLLIEAGVSMPPMLVKGWGIFPMMTDTPAPGERRHGREVLRTAVGGRGAGGGKQIPAVAWSICKCQLRGTVWSEVDVSSGAGGRETQVEPKCLHHLRTASPRRGSFMRLIRAQRRM